MFYDVISKILAPVVIFAVDKAKAEGKYTGRQPTARSQADKVIALKNAGVSRLQIQEQLSISKASYYRILKENAA